MEIMSKATNPVRRVKDFGKFFSYQLHGNLRALTAVCIYYRDIVASTFSIAYRFRNMIEQFLDMLNRTKALHPMPYLSTLLMSSTLCWTAVFGEGCRIELVEVGLN